MVRCLQCAAELDQESGDPCMASISGSIMGDEYTDSYYFCRKCGMFTVRVIHDRFLGEEEIFFRGPLPRSEGDAQIKLIQQCHQPWSKKCRCEIHQRYFGSALD